MQIQTQRRICTIYSMLRSLVLALACATAVFGQPLPLEGIAHVGYRAGDLDKADAYYSGVLGLPRAFRTNDGAAFYKVSDEQYVEIAAGQSPAPPFHIALQTADIEARLARLEQQIAEQASRTSLDTDSTGSRTQDETRDGAHAHTGGVSRPKSDEPQGMDNESSQSGEV